MKKVIYTNDNIKSTVKTAKKPKLMENIIIQACQEYQEKYGPIQTVFPNMKTAAKQPVIIEIPSTSQDLNIFENQNAQTAKTRKKEKGNKNNCSPIHPLESDHNVAILGEKAKQQKSPSQEEYPYISVDMDEVLSHSVGTYVELNPQGLVKSEPLPELESASFEEDEWKTELEAKSMFI